MQNMQQLTPSTPTITALTADTFYFDRGSVLPALHQAYWQIQEGFVRSSTWDADGAMATLGIWGAGNLVSSELSQLDPYQLECLSTVKVDRIVEPTNLAEVLLRQYQQTEELLSIVHCHQVSDRLLKLLTWLAKHFGRSTPEGNQQINIRFTHQQLADVAGTTRVTITRLLGELECSGFIRRLPKHNYILIPKND
jgi:Crp-like helix-turn-helix domain